MHSSSKPTTRFPLQQMVKSNAQRIPTLAQARRQSDRGRRSRNVSGVLPDIQTFVGRGERDWVSSNTRVVPNNPARVLTCCKVLQIVSRAAELGAKFSRNLLTKTRIHPILLSYFLSAQMSPVRTHPVSGLRGEWWSWDHLTGECSDQEAVRATTVGAMSQGYLAFNHLVYQLRAAILF